MKKVLTGCLLVFMLSCGQNYHLSLEELSSLTPTTHNSILNGPLGPVGFDKNTLLEGSCKTEAANGKVVVTTVPANGFSPDYDIEVNLDANGDFSFPVTWVPEISYAIVLKCTNSSAEELSIQEHNVFGVAEIVLDNPGHLFLGKPKTLTGTCSSLLPDGSTDVTVSGATPGAVTCSCTGGWVAWFLHLILKQLHFYKRHLKKGKRST